MRSLQDLESQVDILFEKVICRNIMVLLDVRNGKAVQGRLFRILQ